MLPTILRKLPPSLCFQKDIGFVKVMAQSLGRAATKKPIRIDISSDTVCPWCFVGKKHLDKAIDSTKDQFQFEVKWHPFFLDPCAPEKGTNKREFYSRKFGPESEAMLARMTEVFRGLGMDYDTSGLTGNTMESHRLIYFAGQRAPEKQHELVEELFRGYFTEGKYIGDRGFLIECAKKVGIEGAEEFLADPSNGVEEVKEELEKYSSNIRGVPYYVINGKLKLSGGQPPEVFERAFQAAAI